MEKCQCRNFQYLEDSGILFVMNEEHDNLIEAIQSSGHKACIVVAGGGSGTVHALLSHPGASRFVLEAQIPYSPEALDGYLGSTPASACSEETARQLAQAAFNRASRFTNHASQTIGIACTAALQTNRDRKGEDRAHICIKARNEQILCNVKLEHGSRAGQEEQLASLLLQTIAEFVEAKE